MLLSFSLGDVVLTDLLINESALDMLDLPIKLGYGRLGKLILKIPFKDMWNGQIDAIIEELFILIVPSSQVKYDREKEAKAELEAKRTELARIEKTKQLADAKLQEKIDDSMMEKLIARMIKNIHVEIKRIHVRYEDHVTFKQHPFSMGFTLNRLALESCNDSWLTTGNLKDMYSIQQIFKLLTMDGFAVYLNPNLLQFSKQPASDYLRLFSESIATMDHTLEDYQYLLGPIAVKAKLKLNPKPEVDGSSYTIPKVWLDLEMQKLRIGLTKSQYQTLLQLSEGLDRATKAAPFRKYRPDVSSYRGHYKEWWRFAYKCILEETVKRCRRNWNWLHMKEHRDNCRNYAEIYQMKLTAKKTSKEIEERLTDCERKLDICNLVIIRQRIELEVERLAEKEKSLKAKQGWFGFLWGSSQTEEIEDLNSAAAIMKKFQDAMTPQEKEKLFRAIDYQENSAPTHYPETFVEIDTSFFLHGLQITVSDTDKENPEVVDLQFNGVHAAFKSRPAASAVLVTASVNELKLLGVKQNDRIPSLLKSDSPGVSERSLFSVSYEKNPLDKLCGDRIIVKSKSIHIAYDAHTIIELVKVFKVQNNTALSQIQAAAAERLEGIKEMSALGLEYAIQKHSTLDIQVDLAASQLIVPYGGFYTDQAAVIVVNLGSLKIHSLEKPKDDLATSSVKQLVSMGKSEEDILAHLRKYSYDRFVLKIVNFQALVASEGEDWKSALTTTNHSMALLEPTTLEIQFHKCLITDDPVLPKMRVIGQLPSLALSIEDFRLLAALSIVQSIPLPEDDTGDLEPRPLSKSVSQLSLNYMKELTSVQKEQKQPESVQQSTDLEAKFVMKEFRLTLSRREADHRVTPFIRVEVLQLEAEMIQRTYDQEVMLRLGGIQAKHYHNKEEIYMINTPMSEGRDEYLIVIQYVNVNKHSPEFVTRHGSVVKLLKLEFTTLDVLLHQEALINVLKFMTNMQEKMTASLPAVDEPRDRHVSRRPQLSSIQEDTSTFIKDQFQKRKSKADMKRKRVVECIDLKVKAKIGTISVKMSSDFRDISSFFIEGIAAGFMMKASYSQANVNLTSINIKDLNKASIYQNIVSVEDAEALQVEAVIYNIEPEDVDKNNMSIKVIMGCHRIVFLNAFVTGVMNFLNHFQVAQEAIKEASAAAAEAAKTNIKDVQESAARIELSIKLKAPIIYVPMNSTSQHCLMLDMGHLTIYNNLKALQVQNDNGDSPVIDEMKIELQNLKLSRIKLNKENFNAENEVLLLQPVSFTLLVNRNLSTAWFTSIPDIEMSGRLKAIELLLSHVDYTTVLQLLEENLGEVIEEPQPIQKAPPAPRKSDARKISAPKIEVELVNRNADLQPQKQAHTSIKFEFIMDSLMINLFHGGSKYLKADTSPMHKLEHGLAKFGLSHFAVKGRIFADGLLATSILLMNCTLDDTRHARQGSLTRIMERTSAVPSIDDLTKDDSKPVRSMLDVTVRKSANDMFVDVRVFSFSIIVSLDYLMKVKEFFTIESDQAVQNSGLMASQKGSDLLKKKSAPPPTPPMMTINLLVEKPDIILLEDMDDINSNCIVLNTELQMKIRMIGEHQVISGSIKDLSLLAGVYNPARRADSIYQVLKPCSISIAGSTPEGKGLHVDVCCTDIHLSVSPGVIEILNRVVQKITAKDSETGEEIQADPTHEGLWLITPYEEKNYWFLKTEVAQEAFDYLEYEEDEEVKVYKPELAILSAPNIVLTLEAGVGNKTLPMLMLHLGFQSNVNDWSTKTMVIHSAMSVIMAYYNSRLALWEPLIEPVEVFKNGERTSASWELKTKIAFHDVTEGPSASIVSPSCESEPEEIQHPTRMLVEIQSSDNLEITVTKTCVEVLQQLGQAFSNAMVVSDKVSSSKMAPYLLKNETGLALTLYLAGSNFKVISSTFETSDPVPETYKEVVLESGASVQLAPKKVKAGVDVLEQLKTVSVKDSGDNIFAVMFKGIENRLEIPVLKADKRFFPLKYRKDGSEEWGVISDVVVEDGSTVVTLRSILQVHNHFTKPISVYYMTKRGNEVERLGTVEPDARLNLPLDAVYTPTSIYWLFFSVEGYMVSVEPFVWKDLQKTVSMTKVLKCDSMAKGESKDVFFIQVS